MSMVSPVAAMVVAAIRRGRRWKCMGVLSLALLLSLSL